MLCVLALECSLLAGYHSWKPKAENDLNGGGSEAEEGEKRRNVWCNGGGGWLVVAGGWIVDSDINFLGT